MDIESTTILDAMDRIAAALGHRDFADLRAALCKGAVFLRNLAEYTAVVASLSDDQVIALVENLTETDRGQVLRLYNDLEQYLPTIGSLIIKRMESLAISHGGRPPAFSDRASQREACKMVLDFIGKGYTETDAKKRVASKLGISAQTMNRTWKQRSTLIELSAPEVLDRLLAVLQTAPPNQLEGMALDNARLPNPRADDNS